MESTFWEQCLQPSLFAGAQHFEPRILAIRSSMEAGVGSDGARLFSEFHPDFICLLMRIFTSALQVCP